MQKIRKITLNRLRQAYISQREIADIFAKGAIYCKYGVRLMKQVASSDVLEDFTTRTSPTTYNRKDHYPF